MRIARLASLKIASPFVIFALAASLWPGNTAAFGIQAPPNPPRIAIEVDRLVGLARVWGQVKYFHPTLAYRSEIDWDSALVAAIPRVQATQTREEYALAVQAMLATLDDPLTRVIAPGSQGQAAHLDGQFRYRLTNDGILIINAGNYGALFASSVPGVVEGIRSEYEDAAAVVVDLRSGTPTDTYARFQLTSAFNGLESLFTAEPLNTPGEWYRVYTGHESGGPFSSGQYQTGVFVRGGRRVVPSSGSRGIPIVFVLNEHSGILPITLPLWAAGRARIVFEGDLGRHTIGESVAIELRYGPSQS